MHHSIFYYRPTRSQQYNQPYRIAFDQISFQILHSLAPFNMGGSQTKEAKTVESTGHVNNNLVIGKVNGEVDVYSIEIVILLGIICVIKVIEFIYFMYRRHYQNVKRHLSPRAGITH